MTGPRNEIHEEVLCSDSGKASEREEHPSCPNTTLPSFLPPASSQSSDVMVKLDSHLGLKGYLKDGPQVQRKEEEK